MREIGEAMRNILEEKLKAFRESYFENKEFRTWLKESDLWMALYTCFRVQGIEMGKKELVDVLDGKLIENLPLEIYGFSQSFQALFKEMKASVGMQESLNTRLFKRFYGILYDEEGFRRDNPVIFKWGYVPPHFNSIEEELDKLFKLLDKINSPIDRAIAVHLGIIKIFPYAYKSPVMACVAMYYELMLCDIPLPSFTADNEEYDKIIKKYLSDNFDEFSEMFERSQINRLESVMIFGIESQQR